MVNNETLVRGSIHQVKGNMDKASKEIQKGMQQAARGASLKEYMIGILYSLHMLNLIWTNVGAVTWLHSMRPECSQERSWFFAVMAGTALYHLVACQWQPMADHVERKSLNLAELPGLGKVSKDVENDFDEPPKYSGA